jgi:hypothetical protein
MKHRVNLGQEFVIGGFTPGPHRLDAIIVGYYREGELIYVARTGTDLSQPRVEGCTRSCARSSRLNVPSPTSPRLVTCSMNFTMSALRNFRQGSRFAKLLKRAFLNGWLPWLPHGTVEPL